MRRASPPVAATWMLEHLMLGGKNEALAGDLLEEFKRGRPVSWYWRQVVVAIALGSAKELRNHWLLVVFAVLWTLPYPAFWFYVVRTQAIHVIEIAVRFEWLNSAICQLVVTIAFDLVFVWVGLTLYLLLQSSMTLSLKLHRLVRGLLIGPLVYVLAGLAALPLLHGHSIDPRHVTFGSLMFGGQFMLSRMPLFLSLLISLWAALPTD